MKTKKKTNKKHLSILALIMLINGMSYGILIPLLYPYSAHYGVSPAGLSLLILSYSFFQFIATPIIGRLSDKFGRKPLLLLCLLGTSFSLAFFAFATNVWMLFIARIFDGITGGNNSVAQASAADVTNGPERTKSFGILGAALGFGYLFGPAIGGIMSQISLTAPLWFASALAFFGSILGVLFLEETLHTRKEIEKEPLFRFKTLAAGLLNPPTSTLFLLILLSSTAHGAFIIGAQAYSYDVLKLTERSFGIFLGAAGVVSIIMQAGILVVLMKLIKSKEKLVVASFIGAAITMFILFFAKSLPVFVVFVLLYMVFFSVQNPLISGLISRSTNEEDQGGTLGLTQSYLSLGKIIGPLLMVAVVQFSISGSFLVSSIIFLLGLYITKTFFIKSVGKRKKFDM